MDIYGLIGYPLGHSFSSAFFADKFRSEAIDAKYLNFELSDIAAVNSLVKEYPELRGFNVTIPHKQHIIPYLSVISPEARQIGAVNVVRVVRGPKGSRLEGYNSDVVGFVDSIRPLLRPFHTHALVLGTGGASKAIIYGLRKLGITALSVSRRLQTGSITYEMITPEVMRTHKLIVNCTPLGTFPKVNEAPCLPYDELTQDHLLYDLVYNPEQTLFLAKGAERGATTKNGMEMLRLQALAAWEIWQRPYPNFNVY